MNFLQNKDNLTNINSIKIKTINDFVQIKDLWEDIEEACDMTVFQSFEWNKLLYLEWSQSKYNRLFSDIEVFYIRDSVHKMIIPAIVQYRTTKLKAGLGRKKGIYLLGQGSYSDYLNCIYDTFSEKVFKDLLDYISSKYPNYKFFLYNIREDTEFYRFLSKYYSFVGTTVSVHVEIPNSKEEFDKSLSKHTRQNLRTSLNRINANSLKYEWYVKNMITDRETLETLRSLHMKRMKSKNYNKSTLYKSIISYIKLKLLLYKEKNNNIVEASMQNMENSFAVIVKLQDEIVGYIYGLREKRGVIRILQNCVNEDYKFYSPMFRGIYDYISDNCGNCDINDIDFTRGDEEYKYKLGGKEVKLYNFVI